MAWPKKKDEKGEKLVKNLQKSELTEKAPEFVAPAVVETIPSVSEQLIGPPEVVEEQAAVQPMERISVSVPPAVARSAAPTIVKDEVAKQIEEILSEDLTDLFLNMNPEQQEEFRAKGEETASKIRVLLSSAKVGVKKILALITDWLRLIPGVNKFFLEQEAKIKTDKILLNAEDFRKEGKL